MNCQHLSSHLAKEISGVRERRIRILRKKIASGKYTIDSAQIAKALVPPEKINNIAH